MALALDPKDRAFFGEIAALAADRGILIHIHSGAEPVKLLYELEPELTVIWAHAGMTEPPGVVGPMLDSHPRLYADTSYREHDILGADDSIDPAWRDVILAHPDRFLVGTDTWVNGQWSAYEDLISINRRWLSRFPRPVAEMIAYKNAERLFGRKVSPALVCKR